MNRPKKVLWTNFKNANNVVDNVFHAIEAERLWRNPTDHYAPWVLDLLEQHKKLLKKGLRKEMDALLELKFIIGERTYPNLLEMEVR
jgi:hypothetical protein